MWVTSAMDKAVREDHARRKKMPDKYWLCNNYGREHQQFQEISMLNVLEYMPGITKNDICKYLKLETFDYALPITWLTDVAKVTGIYADAHFVWDYSEGNYDQPLAITREGETILRIYNYIKEKQHG